MSSPKAAAKTAAKPKSAVRSSTKPKARPTAGTASSEQAMQLAAELERGLIEGNNDVVSGEALQKLMAALCKTYSHHVQGGNPGLPLQRRSGVSATDVMIQPLRQ